MKYFIVLKDANIVTAHAKVAVKLKQLSYFEITAL